MMDLATIQHLSEQAARKAKRHSRKPYVLHPAVKSAGNLQAFCSQVPNLGSYCPRGWKRIDPTDWYGDARGVYPGGFFVDKTGWGGDYEPALTPQQFFDLTKPGYGYAIIEEGQFQIHIGVFEESR